MPKDLHQYLVTIPYKEPVYEVHRGRPRESPYMARIEVEAESKEEAIERALNQFSLEASLSNVGWSRVPNYKDIKVELL